MPRETPTRHAIAKRADVCQGSLMHFHRTLPFVGSLLLACPATLSAAEDFSFDALRERLKPGRNATLQIITIAENRWHVYRKSVDFIQKYIFHIVNRR